MAFFVVFWGFELNLTQFNVRPQPPRFFGKRIGDTQEAGRHDQKLMSLSFESGWGSTWPHTLFQVGHLCKQLFVLEAALCLVTPAAVLIQKPHVLYFMSVSSQCNFAQHTKHMQSCCVEVFYFFIFPKSNKYWHRFFFFFFWVMFFQTEAHNYLNQCHFCAWSLAHQKPTGIIIEHHSTTLLYTTLMCMRERENIVRTVLQRTFFFCLFYILIII